MFMFCIYGCDVAWCYEVRKEILLIVVVY